MTRSVVASPLAAQAVLQKELVALFSELAKRFGNPPWSGAIYRLLFAEESPLSLRSQKKFCKKTEKIRLGFSQPFAAALPLFLPWISSS